MTVAIKPPPKDWPRISSSLAYNDAAAAIDFLVRAFGFEVKLKVDAPNGKIAHSELVLGSGLVMLGDANKTEWRKSPRELGGCTQALCVYIDDADAHCARARAAGATISKEPENSDYGEGYWIDRGYEAVDLEGHHWYFVQRIADR